MNHGSSVKLKKGESVQLTAQSGETQGIGMRAQGWKDARTQIVLLSTKDFDAMDVETSTLELSMPGGPKAGVIMYTSSKGTILPMKARSDENGDGRTDMVYYFYDHELNSRGSDFDRSRLTLEGALSDGSAFVAQVGGASSKGGSSGELSWSSSDTDVVRVSSSGKATGVSSGKASVTATAAGDPILTVSVEVSSTAPSSPSVSSALAAFPGAEGFGADALGQCRSKPLQLLFVTNTNTDGPGSLAEAASQIRSDRFTFILFETGGHIRSPASTGIRISNSCVYVAGQTAPGSGVVIEGQPTGLWIRGGAPITDVVMRHLRFRGRANRTSNNLIIAKGERIVLDHMSFSWADNYLLALLRYGGRSWSGPIRDVSIQNTVISEVFAAHPTGFVLGTNADLKDANSIQMTNISVHRNLMAHNSVRNPMTAADNAVLANNIMYNWDLGAGVMNRRGKVDWVNNYGKPGPMTRGNRPYLVNPYCDDRDGNFSIYASGNVGPAGDYKVGDNWNGETRQVACQGWSGDDAGDEVPSAWRRSSAQSWAHKGGQFTLLSASAAYRSVLDDVGANAQLTCDGSWTDAADPVDRRVVSEVRNDRGPSSPPANESQAGGYPRYSSGSACSDRDSDGLPDAWERRYFSCDTCADPDTRGRDGYLYIEHYVNGTRP